MTYFRTALAAAIVTASVIVRGQVGGALSVNVDTFTPGIHTIGTCFASRAAGTAPVATFPCDVLVWIAGVGVTHTVALTACSFTRFTAPVKRT